MHNGSTLTIFCDISTRRNSKNNYLILKKVKHARIVWCPRTESNRGPIDYKSIALPAELQGHFVSCEVFTAKHQLNQCIKNNIGVRCLLAAHLNCDGKLLNVTDLSAWSRYGNPASHGISKACFHPLKITKIMEWKNEKNNKVYTS